jgi:hypothetical protein
VARTTSGSPAPPPGGLGVAGKLAEVSAAWGRLQHSVQANPVPELLRSPCTGKAQAALGEPGAHTKNQVPSGADRTIICEPLIRIAAFPEYYESPATN